MMRWQKLVLGVVGAALCAGFVTLGVKTRAEAHRLVTNPLKTRKLPDRTPIDYGMAYDEATAHTSDGLALAGWFIPSTNGALVIAQHGYKSDRTEMLDEAAMLHRHGYSVLVSSVRAHDMSDGELLTFGKEEMKDVDAWFQFVDTHAGIDPARVGMLGNSLGGSLAIEYAADHPHVKAVVAVSAFSSLSDTISTSLHYFTGLPSFPFTPLITFWAEREAGFKRDDVDAKRWIGRISPRPVLLMQGGADVVISPSSGQRLYDAAGEPKQLWYEPTVGHAAFDRAFPVEYEGRVTQFFDTYLLGK